MQLSDKKFANRKGKPLKKSMACTLAVTVAQLGGISAMAASGGSANTTQAQPTPAPQRQPRATEAERRTILVRNATINREIFDAANPDNLVPGKSYRALTSTDFQSLPREADVLISSALLAYSEEFYDVVDSMRPTAMSRDEFFHVLLREAARRDTVVQVINNTGHVPPAVANQNVTISRPLDVPPAQRTTATLPARDAVYRDVATTLLQNPRRRIVDIESDVARQIGIGGGIFMETDTSAVIAGYLAGSNRRFFDGTQAGQPAGPLPLTVGFNNSITQPQIRAAYCAIMPAIVQPGRARGADQNMATSAGIVMAREDARTNFTNNEPRLAFKGVSCPTIPAPWNYNTMGQAITGIDLLPEHGGARR